MLGDPGRLREMEIFAMVASEGSFSAAARASRLSPSAVSKTIARLEQRLGVPLVMRTTRALTLTAEGRDLQLRVVAILAALDSAEREAAAGQEPAGPVHISTSASYACHRLYPVLPQLLALYPQLTVKVSQTDEVVDLLENQADLAIRAGEMPSSGLVARSLGSTRRLLVAAPAYLEREGPLPSVEALAGCSLIGFSYSRRSRPWPFRVGDRLIDLEILPRLQASDGEGVRQMALNGLGIARLAEFTVAGDIAAGRLVEILPDMNAGEDEPFHAVRLGLSGEVPSRLRVVLDFLADHGRVDPKRAGARAPGPRSSVRPSLPSTGR
ncbi:LysR family transcriptional regulator [Pseudoroseicyclus aestuarii]|uniref:LysR family transcriptional regulator n=1 Tax=Pseudoroseicyclus aestuarii TaxID=1795041 RepID=A0A318SYD3_9RHOB|nr:LysR family transcriptional regulator [Pseudoroseicyclus aestuarii]PYE80573.1 LysR family transcriptional regulator [Pseudoroseicyclus aestuarii]